MYGLRYRPTQPNVFHVTQPDAEASFGTMVRERRALLRLTQEELRRRLLDSYGIDLSKTAMSRLEAGERPIRLNEVHALAQLLELDLTVFGRSPTRSVVEELDETLQDIRAQLSAFDQEIAVASAQAENARTALEEAETRLRELATGRSALLQIREHVVRDVMKFADARRREELTNGDR